MLATGGLTLDGRTALSGHAHPDFAQVLSRSFHWHSFICTLALLFLIPLLYLQTFSFQMPSAERQLAGAVFRVVHTRNIWTVAVVSKEGDKESEWVLLHITSNNCLAMP